MEKISQLCRVAADIALNVGYIMSDEDFIDMPDLSGHIVSWAEEFMQIHKDTDWADGKEDYAQLVGRFSADKWNQFLFPLMVGYQVVDDEGNIPDGLFSFQVFRTEKEAAGYIRTHGLTGYKPVAVREGDIKDYSYIEGMTVYKQAERVQVKCGDGSIYDAVVVADTVADSDDFLVEVHIFTNYEDDDSSGITTRKVRAGDIIAEVLQNV